MFNSVTSERLRALPSVEGVDSKRIPQILSQVYAHIVGLKAKYDVGVLTFDAVEIGEDYQMLSDLAFTLELYLESGRFSEHNDAIAFPYSFGILWLFAYLTRSVRGVELSF